MAKATNSGFNPDFRSELNIESIISAPLVAASKANVEMLRGQTRALLENCFTVNHETGAHEPVLIQMSITRNVMEEVKNADIPVSPHSKEIQLTFSVPLLCIMPINSLAIDKVTVDFDMEITSVTSRENDKGVISKQAQLNGKISNQYTPSDNNTKEQYKKQSTSNLKVNINAGQLPLPVGVLTILDLYAKAIQPVNTIQK
jgi:hypothetical protein